MAEAGDKTGQCPKEWKLPVLVGWLENNPMTKEDDVDFLIKQVEQRKNLAISAAAEKTKHAEDMKGRWARLEPMLCAIHALVDDVEVKKLYLD